jgi:hypothetical protein
MIRFNANLYRIAMLCSSNEETRYYLQGAYVEPHAVKGVTLVATDGNKLVAIYDENGFADESAIIKLTPDALKACKPGRYERRDVTIATDSNDATVNVTKVDGTEILADTPVAFSQDCKVDGTFPDYRRVIPASVFFTKDSSSPGLSTIVLNSLSAIASELGKHYGTSKGVLRINADCDNGPALITFPPTFNAFAVAMPMRTDCETIAPEWFTGKAAAPSAQARVAATRAPSR